MANKNRPNSHAGALVLSVMVNKHRPDNRCRGPWLLQNGKYRSATHEVDKYGHDCYEVGPVFSSLSNIGLHEVGPCFLKHDKYRSDSHALNQHGTLHYGKHRPYSDAMGLSPLQYDKCRPYSHAVDPGTLHLCGKYLPHNQCSEF